jgi:sialate O-acetylesterase
LLLGLALLLIPALATTSRAQFGGLGAAPAPSNVDPKFQLKEPAAHQVYQRDRNGQASIRLVPKTEGATITGASMVGTQGQPVEGVRFADGALVGVPTGGPYAVQYTIKVDDNVQLSTVSPVFVGDLWVLAGQSNMEGVADLIDVTPPNPQVMLLGMDGKWDRAEEPLHWLVDSPDPVHSGDPSTRAERSEKAHKTRKKGAGLGLPFAVAMVEATNVPVGLVACAHGGTSMGQWNPAKKDDGGNSLYGSMLRQFKLAGGKVRGVLWYQGESDANDKAAEVYPRVFADFIAAVRKDFEQPDLPFYLVQIGRFIRTGDPKAWNAVQDAERRIPERVPNTAVVAAVDLELDDGIHVGTNGHKRLGRRLAHIALHELFGLPGGSTPTLDKVVKGPGNSLQVKIKGVNPADSRSQMGGPDSIARGPYGLRPSRHIGGFSIRKADGTEIPLIFDAAVGPSKDTVILKLSNKIPEGAFLWYGWGCDPYCNLTDSTDAAVPVFGPIPLDEVE